MDLMATLYPQEKLVSLMKSMGSEERLALFPWINGQLIMTDARGITQGFIVNDLAGDNDFALYNEHMNFIAATNEVQDFTILQDFTGNALSYITGNAHGGFTEFTFTGEQISAFGSAFGGYDLFDTSLQALGQSQELYDHIQWTPSSTSSTVFSENLAEFTLSPEIDIHLDSLDDFANVTLDFLDFL